MKKSFTVDSTYNDMRIDRWLRHSLGKIPQGLIEKSLRSGKIKLNKKKIKSSYKIKTNDKIELFNFNFEEKILKDKVKFNPTKEIIKSNENLIIENNENFIAINKSSGISVQGGTKSKNLIDIFAKSDFLKIVNLILFIDLIKIHQEYLSLQKRESAQLLTSLFRLRKVHKTYLAICHGELQKNSGEWNNHLIRYDKGKKIIEKAKTIFKVIDKNSEASLVELKPITGRKHQLRKQLYLLGQPIFGDTKYKLSNSNKGINKNLMLHSYQIKFMINDIKHTYTALIPDYFRKLLKAKRLNF